MAKPRTGQVPQLTLGRPDGMGQVHVSMEAFFEFSFWMAESLEDLIAIWSRRLPPRANPRPRKRYVPLDGDR